MEKLFEETKLKGSYVPGSQMWFPKGSFFDRDNNLRGFGCGVVACMDFCVYRGEIALSKDTAEYCEKVRAMAHSFFPIMPGLGIAPYYYPILLNLFFKRNHMPYRVEKSCRGKNLTKMAELLNLDLPVILCVGPTIPVIFKNKSIPLYLCREKEGASILYPSRHRVKSHYMTVIGITKDSEGTVFLKTATWGEILYLKLDDYLGYTKYTFPGTNRFYCLKKRA